jgi:hypothetical protein
MRSAGDIITLAAFWLPINCFEKLATRVQVGNILSIHRRWCFHHSAELFLKSLLVLEKGEAPPQHRLDVLFKRVSHKRQRRIQEFWEADARSKIMQFCQSMNVPSDLGNALVKCGSAFENLRYYYEKLEVTYYIGDFAWIVMRVVVQLKPLWKPQEPPPVRL